MKQRINGKSLDITQGANLQGANLQSADLQGANLQVANLQRANLQGADLQGANLQVANLQRANLYRASPYMANLQSADLQGADLRGANLQDATLRDANLQGANLQGADLKNANLQGANLHGADLHGANLRGANLQGADLRSARHIDTYTQAVLTIVPDGELRVYKACRQGVVTLLIPKEAKRSNATTRKCRAEFAYVVETPQHKPAFSGNDPDFVYIENTTVYPDRWDTNRWNECSNGIHFFLTPEEAEDYKI